MSVGARCLCVRLCQRTQEQSNRATVVRVTHVPVI